MGKGKTILYVEDDAVIMAANKMLLQRHGYTVQPARDGIEALNFLNRSLPDLMLLDLMLPRLNGEDVLKMVYANPRLKHLPIIVLSTNSVLNMANEHLVEKTGRQLFKHDCSVRKLLQTIAETLLQAAADQDQRAAASTPVQKTNSAAPPIAGFNPLTDDIQSLQKEPQIVCAWTNRIKVDGDWMNFTEFLSKHLNVPVTHGISPEAMESMQAEVQ